MTQGRAPALLAALALSGCVGLDADEARVCRTALPALEGPGVGIAVTRARAAGERAVRIEYRATGADGRAAERFAVCRFAPALSAADRGRLAAIETDRGPVAGATLFLLQRFFLDSPEGAAADPGAPVGADLPEWPAPLAYAAQQAIVGAPGAATYGLLAAAYALLFGLVGRINLAFGELAAVGAAAFGLVAVGLGGGAAPGAAGLAAALLAAVAAGALHGVVAGRVAFAAIPPERAQASLIATVGLSLALSEYLRLAGGATPDWLPPLGAEPIALARAGPFVVTATAAGLATAATGLGAAAALAGAMRGSRFGRAWRAAADEPLAAALCGVDGRRLLLTTLLLSGALAGLAGALVAFRFGALGFAGGFALGLKALAAAVLGGVGSVGGALLGGLAIGAAETLWSAYGPGEGREMALTAVLIAAIALRLHGLLGRPVP